MSKRIAILNIIITIADTFVCLAAVTGFGYAAIHFSKWWITLFSFVPLALYNAHSIILDASVESSEKEGEGNS